MSPYAALVRDAVRAAEFGPRLRLLWFGEPVPGPLSSRRARAFPPEVVRECVVANLADHLYRYFYTTGEARPRFSHADAAQGSCDLPGHVERLSDANVGAGYFEAGWVLRRVADAAAIVYGRGLEVGVPLADCVLPPDAAPGCVLGVRLPKEYRSRLPGAYLAVGNDALADGDWRGAVRLYWNVTPEGAVRLMRGASARLNDAGVPFQLKVLSDPLRFPRCDAAVCYFRGRDYDRAAGILEPLARELAEDLRPGVPALTKPLAHGIGFAEQPDGDVSFGEHRCRLLAEALIGAEELGRRSLEERCEVVARRFLECDLSLERPYLRPGADDAYGPWRHAAPPARVDRAVPRDRPGRYEDDCLEAALRIGRELCQTAIWSGGRCNWTGTHVDTAGGIGHGALGISLYDGTAGVALFLAELHAAAGDAGARRTALGAIRQAMSRIDRVAPQARVGLFTGWPGIALAAARIGAILEDESLVRDARRVAATVGPQDEAFDLVAGAAGAIVGLLALGAIDEAAPVLEWCAPLGEALLKGGRRTAHDWSWPTAVQGRTRHLTGISHGAAGIGTALFELFRAARDERYRDAAGCAFAYERRVFDQKARNWPDLRARAGRRTPAALPAGTFWCHGAPGIALSRLRAHEVTGDPTCRAEAVTALEASLAFTARAARSGHAGFSLCHGLAGNASVLRAGAAAFGRAWAGSAAAEAVVRDVALGGINRYAASAGWPSGTAGPAPGLMIGLAGVGHFYLRERRPATPSVLLVRPQEFTCRRAAPGAPAEVSARESGHARVASGRR